MQIRTIAVRGGQSHILVAICLLLTLTLLHEQVEAKQQNFYQTSKLQNQQPIKNPYGNIFGITTSRPNSIPNVGSNNLQKKPTKATRHPQLQPPEDDVVDRYNIRYPDGSYEFRYELADGTTRYERGYFVRLDKVKKTLIVVGYYAYRLPDGRYLTVFYNADQFGYRQNQSITPETYPNLPRSIDVPQLRNLPEEQQASENNHIDEH